MQCEVKDIDLSEEWKGSDLILIVEGKRLHTHRLVLSLHSEVFDKMFTSDFKEKNLKEIELPGKCYEEIKEMLEVLYDRRKEVNESNIAFLLDLSEEYQLLQLQKSCIDFHHQADKSTENAIKFIPLLRRFGLKDLEEVCFNKIKSMSFAELLRSDDFQNSSDESKLDMTLAKGQYSEGVLKKQTAAMESLIYHLYLSAHRTYIEQLQEKGYEESLLAYCEQKDKHTQRKPGQRFDIACSSCRKRVRMAKEFIVKMKHVVDLIDAWYSSKEKL